MDSDGQDQVARRSVLKWGALGAAAACSKGLAAAAEPVQEYAKVVSKTPGLAAYWRFEGDCKDEKGLADGKVAGGAVKFVAGPGGGKAIVLDAGRLVTTGESPKLDTAKGTIELWFKPTFAPGVGYNPCIIAKRSSPARTRWSIHVWHDYSCVAFWNGKQVEQFTPAWGNLQKGRWYYLVVTSDGRELRAYLDGIPCTPASSTAVFNLAMKGLPIQIASSTPAGVEAFDSVIDEVAIYSRALSADEIARHADAMGWKKRREEIARKQKAIEAERKARREKRLAELTDPKRLFARGKSKVYRGEQLGAVRLGIGGIGAGVIQMDGHARGAIWQIFNNYRGAFVPDSFMAVRVQTGDDKPVVRALQDQPVGPFEAMKELTFRGEYPFGWYTFKDPAVAVHLSMEVFNPLVPLDAKSSGIPCAVFNLTAENRSKREASVSFLASQQNAVGATGNVKITGTACKEYGGNVNRVQWRAGAALVHMTAGGKKARPGWGDMVLMALAPDTTATASWADSAKLAADFAADGALTGPRATTPSEAGKTHNAAVAAPIKLKPGEKKTVTFVLTWYFPNARHGHGGWGGGGNMYQNWWPDAMGVASHLQENLAELTRKTRLYHDTLYASNLPWWLVDRISSQVAVLRSRTCFWTKDGYFGGWEGCCPTSGCCYGNCSHVWHYAQAHARLFPEVARLMRQQEFRFQAPNGSVPFRQPKHGPATDGQCGTVLNSYREHLMCPDGKWLTKHWPSIKKAMEFIIATWDRDEDGVMAGVQWNTLDCAIDGSSSWLGSLYLAALGAAEKMADLRGQPKLAARYRKIRKSGMTAQDRTLFNDEYYIQLPGKTRQRDYFTGCHIDQVLGQWWAHQLDLGWLYPRDRVRTALESLVKYNFRTDFHGVRQVPRKFVADEDAGMQMIRWPKGGRPPGNKAMLYGDEVMTGFEYSAAVAMVQAGLVREGFMVTRAIYDRYDGGLRTHLTGTRTASWGYSGNPFGDDECGKFYARAMSVWSMLLACQGFVCDSPGGVIGFRPIWKPEDHASFFTSAEGWGLFTQRRAKGKQTELIELRSGKLVLKSLVFELPAGSAPTGVKATVGLKMAAAKVTTDGPKESPSGTRVRVALGGTLSLQAGQTLRVEISY